MIKKVIFHSVLILGSFVLASCAHTNEEYSNLKSVQVFHSNSGSNYYFENSKTMEEKNGEQN